MNPIWLEAVEAFGKFQRAGGAPATSVLARRQHLMHLARRVAKGPYDLTAGDLLEYLQAQEWKPETRRSRRTTLRAFYGWALTQRLVADNIALELPRVKASKAFPRPVPASVYQEAMAAAQPRVKLMLRMAYELGLRRAEIAQGHSRDLVEDLAGWSLIVHGKGNKTRLVPLTPRLALELRSLPAGYFFPGEDNGHLSARYVGKLAARVLPEPWTIHTLRHSFASRAYGVANDLFVVQELLGHASPATTRVYVQLDDGAMRRTVLAAS